jgi:hypothetical protein
VGATLLERGDKFSDEAEIVRALQAAGADQERAGRIVSTCREAEDLDHARCLLEVTLPTLNGAIALLGSPWEPLRFESRLKRSFDKWVSAERGRLERMVRDSFIDIFDSGAPLTDYSRRKMLDWVSFDPSWVEEFDELPTDVIERRVAGLAGELLPTAQSAPEGSPDSVREKNRLLLVNSYQKISRLLGAWRAAGPGRTVHEVWSLGSEQTVRAAIASGALDFRVLDEGALPRELGRAGLWPEGMVLSLETSEHELGEADLLALDKKRDQDRQESLIAQRTVRFGEVDVDGGGGAPLQDVARALAHGVDDAAFFKRSGVASLAGFGVNVRTGGSGRAGRSARNADPEYMSAEQRELVGFAGEFAAYKYLRRNVRNFSDEFWVSSLGRRYLGLPVGDDSAGCDFHVKRAIRRPDLLFEVKASAGDPGFIDLEPSQVEAAASLATGDEAIWHVLYVTHVRSPSLIAVHELPNPFSVEGRKVLKPSGRQAMRFEFARK